MKVKDKEKLNNPLKGWQILSAISSMVFHTVHCATQTLCHCIQIETFWHPDILQPRHFATPVILKPRHFATEALSYSTIYSNSCDFGTAHASLAFGQLGTYAGLRPNRILQCKALLAAGGYNQPCGPIDSLFLLSPAHMLDGRAQLYNSELSYSFFILLHHPC